jgi:hypothetical protein
MYGGGQGSGWTMGGPLVPGLASDATVRQSYDACLSASRPGQIPFSQGGGLPGMSGQRGGAYTNNLSSNIAGFAQIDRDTSHCMPNHSNPMNNGMIKQSGGGSSISVAASASPILEEHTARYTTAPSQWTGSTGAPILLNQPLDGVAWSKACTQTGGRRKNKNKNKNKNKTKKNRSYRKKQRGGDLKEEAVKVLKDSGYMAEYNPAWASQTPIDVFVLGEISRELGCGGEKEIGDYKFKHNGGFYNGTLLVKRKDENDSKYVIIYYSHVCSQ